MHSILDRGNAIGKFIHCQSGDLVVWDSRLVHCNSCAFISDESSSAFNLPKISLEKLDVYQRALIIGTNVDDE
ncbi:unnamed protein product [Rotaria sordida]|uniref:Uncharacterized protein n=1 Tax=Rotaria sordida TaxID=392033 RepID=A0A819EGQ3_9BILA|nr:unnamed protein product [Rotaria sordida]CAF3850710.1 unnamed protein product [Rotaria sordida]CAF3859820.1 unnamed protein product [Rotaria sordida]